MPSFDMNYAHPKKCKIQNSREIIGEIEHCAVAVGGLFGRPFRRPVEGPFADCSVFAVTCALFAGRDALIVCRGGGLRRVFAHHKCEILILARVL